MSRARQLVCALLAVVASACSENLRPEDASFTGRVSVTTEVTKNQTVVALDSIEAASPAFTVRAEAARIFVGHETKIFAEDAGGRRTPISASSVAPGSVAIVWTTGAEMRTLPPTYEARAIVILPKKLVAAR